MERKVVQDIVPANKRSIRNLPPKKKHISVEEEDGAEVVEIRRTPASSSIARSQARYETAKPARRPTLKELAGDDEPLPTPARITRVSPQPKQRRGFSGIIITFIIIFVGIAVIAVALSLLYSKASVTITPKTAHIDINGTYTAKKTGDANLTSSTMLYETVSATQSASQTVPAAAGPVISNKAKGTATLFNEQTTQQKIVAGTRLANAQGEVYRTTTTVVIPASGKIDVAILADQAGAEYNMTLSGASDLKVVAYKDTPKYTTVYGKIKTAITGGFAGTKQTIAPEVQKAAIASLKESLGAKLLTEATTQVTKDSILYPGAQTIEYDVGEPVAKGKDGAEITVKGTLTGAVFNRTALIKSIAAKELDKFPAPTYNITGIEDLRFTLVNTKDFAPQKGTPLIFSLKGPVNLIGTIVEADLKDDLKGTDLKDSNTIFAKYPSIANAYALITPFWMRSFPNSADKIIIEIKK